MLSKCGHAVYFNKSDVIKIFIVEVNMSVVRIVLGSFHLISTYDLVGNSIIVFGSNKAEVRTIVSCSSKFIFSSGSNLNKDLLFPPSDIAGST